MDIISNLKFTKGHNSIKNEGRVTVLDSAHLLMMLHICTKFGSNIYKGFRVTELMQFPIFKFSKGNYSVKYVGGVTVLVPCTSSDNALYLYIVS